MWVRKCDLCGEEKPRMSRFRYKIKVKKECVDWEDRWWEKVDLCEDCQERIVKYIIREKSLPDRVDAKFSMGGAGGK